MWNIGNYIGLIYQYYTHIFYRSGVNHDTLVQDILTPFPRQSDVSNRKEPGFLTGKTIYMIVFLK